MLVLFKGSANGRISKNKFPTFPKEILYACQHNAWMDEQVMLVWVEQILKPNISTAPPGIVPILLLDSYRCHMMQSVVRAIEDLGCEVDHIPGGCTSLCQPVDVGVNTKPLKTRMKQKWETWMINELLHQDGVVRPPTRRHIAEWCLHTSSNLPEQIVSNAWRHGRFSYFVHQPQQDPQPQQEQEQPPGARDEVEAAHKTQELAAEEAEQEQDHHELEQDDLEQQSYNNTMSTFPSLLNTMSLMQNLERHQQHEFEDNHDDEYDGNSSGDYEEPNNSEPLLSFNVIDDSQGYQPQQHDIGPARITQLPRADEDKESKIPEYRMTTKNIRKTIQRHCFLTILLYKCMRIY